MITAILAGRIAVLTIFIDESTVTPAAFRMDEVVRCAGSAVLVDWIAASIVARARAIILAMSRIGTLVILRPAIPAGGTVAVAGTLGFVFLMRSLMEIVTGLTGIL